MKYRKISKLHILPLLLSLTLLFQTVGWTPFFNVANAQTGYVNTECLNLRSGPGTGYPSVAKLSTNTKVEIEDSVTGSDGKIWYLVSTASGNGYLRSDYVNLRIIYNSADSSFEEYLDQQGFPESYKNALRGLHQKYPEWVFVAQHTGLEWETVILEEAKTGRNLVESDSVSSWKSTEEGAFDWAANYWPGFDGRNWVAASRGIIEYYMDPRNFLTETSVFQFQTQKYDPAVQTRECLQKLVQGTFLEKEISGKSAFSSQEGYGPGYVKPSETGSGASLNGPVASLGSCLSEGLFAVFGGIVAQAEWIKQEGNWIYLTETGARCVSGWFWLDGNGDGVSECYYFDEYGIMASDTMIGDYQVNSDGQWTVNGVIQTRGRKNENSNAAGASSTGTSYVDLLMEAAARSGVSPYVLASMIIQEQGTDGNSPLISGTCSYCPGYYNFYNIAAYEHDGMTAVEAGLRYASESGNGNRPWNTVEKGIIGGAIAYGANYTDSGQDTFYLKKFNVQGDNKYNHQFMSNIVAAAQEGSMLSAAYTEEIKHSALMFRIPVYKNMPETNCEKPTGDGSPNNRLASLTVSGGSLTPAYQMNVCEYSLTVDGSVSSVEVSAVPVDSSAVVTGTGRIQLSAGINAVQIIVKAGNGDRREYFIKITRQGGDNGNTSPAPSPAGPSAPAGGSSGGPGIPEEEHESNVEFCGPPM